MFKLSMAIGIIGAAALAACGESNDTTSFGGGASGTDGGNASGGASAGASGGGNTSMAGAGGATAGAGGASAGVGGTVTAGAGGKSTAGNSGAGGGNSAAGAGGAGNGGANSDGGAAGGASGSSGSGGTSGDGAPACVRGVECTGFPTTWVRGCTNDDSCVGEVHQTDCCGALRVMGMNHSEASTFCPAERTDCRPQYPTPAGCTSDRVVTDTGNTGSLDNVAARCAGINQGVGTCTTYVCGTSSTPACPSARHIGTCG